MRLIVEEKWSQAKVARHFDVSREAVRQWYDAYQARGEAGLASGPHDGAPPRLSQRQRVRLVRLLEKSPERFGFAGDLWTTRRVADLIAHEFGVRYHADHVGRLLHQLGLSWQKPKRRAIERDEKAIARWLRFKWPAIKRGPRGAGRSSRSSTRAGSR